ncbi:MAG: hypothetical protein GX980_11780 [Firmicutes bacterium]|nr:hypothetical protein [Bacillota bacterium]
MEPEKGVKAMSLWGTRNRFWSGLLSGTILGVGLALFYVVRTAPLGGRILRRRLTQRGKGARRALEHSADRLNVAYRSGRKAVEKTLAGIVK